MIQSIRSRISLEALPQSMFLQLSRVQDELRFTTDRQPPRDLLLVYWLALKKKGVPRRPCFGDQCSDCMKGSLFFNPCHCTSSRIRHCGLLGSLDCPHRCLDLQTTIRFCTLPSSSTIMMTFSTFFSAIKIIPLLLHATDIELEDDLRRKFTLPEPGVPRPLSMHPQCQVQVRSCARSSMNHRRLVDLRGAFTESRITRSSSSS